MLVKIIAMGSSEPVWKNVFHHLRMALPDHPFAAGIFSTPDEIRYLLQDYYPAHWGAEAPDLLLSEPPTDALWSGRLAFLEQIQAGDPEIAEGIVMALPALESGLKQLIQGPFPVRLLLDNGAGFVLSDPDLVRRAIPEDFPRVRLNEYVTSLRWRQKDGRWVDVLPHQLKPGTVLGLGELDTVVAAGATLGVDEWLRRVVKAAQARLAPGSVTGLIRESKGLFLFPGLPCDRVTGVTVGPVTFSGLLDLGQLTLQSPHFAAAMETIAKCSQRQVRRWRALARQYRAAEAKRDVPLWCAGEIDLLNQTVAAHLRALGYARCATVLAPQEGQFREPSLLIQISPWAGGGFGNQVEPPDVLDAGAEITAALRPLEGLPGVEAVPFDSADVMLPALPPKALAAEKRAILARVTRAGSAATLINRRCLLLRQETGIVHEALARLAELLAGPDAARVWSGAVPSGVQKAIVYGHDSEQAGAILQALREVPKKRWFDLSPYTTPEAVAALPLEPLKEYGRGGLAVITAAARERMTEQRRRLEQELATALRGLAEAEAEQRRSRDEAAQAAAAGQQLVRRWVSQAAQAWLDASADPFEDLLGHVRRRQERRWFSRALVNRVLILSSQEENRAALLDACRAVYPRFSPELSVAVPYGFEPLLGLPGEERAGLLQAAEAKGLDAAAARQRIQAELERQNEELFRAYLRLLRDNLDNFHADLVIVENRSSVAGRLLEQVRMLFPALREAPAVLIIPEAWAPPENTPLPWPWTRIVALRRFGAIAAQECAEALRGIHPA
jgi:hypothetical protein